MSRNVQAILWSDFGSRYGKVRPTVASKPAGSSVQFHQPRRRHGDNRGRFKVNWTFLNVDCYRCETSRASLASPDRARQATRVRLGPRNPRHTLVLEIAPPKIAPMTEQQFTRAVEILAEMLADREGDFPSNRAWGAFIGVTTGSGIVASNLARQTHPDRAYFVEPAADQSAKRHPAA